MDKGVRDPQEELELELELELEERLLLFHSSLCSGAHSCHAAAF